MSFHFQFFNKIVSNDILMGPHNRKLDISKILLTLKN